MTQHTEDRVVAFVRVIAGRCRVCLRRRPENCQRCDSSIANRLMRDIETDRRLPPKDYSLFTRMALIAEILKNRAPRPLLATEINLEGLCSNQLKNWTLKRMIRNGIVGRHLAFTTDTGYRVYRYFLLKKQGDQNNEDHDTRIGERQAHQGVAPRSN